MTDAISTTDGTSTAVVLTMDRVRLHPQRAPQVPPPCAPVQLFLADVPLVGDSRLYRALRDIRPQGASAA